MTSSLIANYADTGITILIGLVILGFGIFAFKKKSKAAPLFLNGKVLFVLGLIVLSSGVYKLIEFSPNWKYYETPSATASVKFPTQPELTVASERDKVLVSESRSDNTLLALTETNVTSQQVYGREIRQTVPSLNTIAKRLREKFEQRGDLLDFEIASEEDEISCIVINKKDMQETSVFAKYYDGYLFILTASYPLKAEPTESAHRFIDSFTLGKIAKNRR